MRDLAEKWPAAPDWQAAVLNLGGVIVKTVSGLNQSLVSGDLAAWADFSGIVGQGAGANDLVRGDRYALRVARDRMLVVSARPLTVAPGWHRQGFAVTNMDAALHVFDIAGPGVPRLLARATTAAPDANSTSAALLFAGVSVCVYRFEDAQHIRVHVDRGLAPYLWEWLEQSLAL